MDNIDDVFEFKRLMEFMKNNNPNFDPENQEYISNLELDFEKYRPFGDERDFHLFDSCGKDMPIKCLVHRVSPVIKPESVFMPPNAFFMCEGCIKKAIESFKKFKSMDRKENLEIKTSEKTKEMKEQFQQLKMKIKKGDMVKVCYTALNKKRECMWFQIIEKRKGGKFKAVLTNQPFHKHPNNLTLGSIVIFHSKDIIDIDWKQ